VAFGFDLEAAIDQIATLEVAISTPGPGIVTAYGYGENPSSVPLSALPAIVHVPLGPTSEFLDIQSGLASYGSFGLSFDIYSRALIIEAIPGKYPSDDEAANLFWEPIAETFFSLTNHAALASAANADNYTCIFDEQSYQPRIWPPIPGSDKWYWSFQYIHRFMFEST
jgi:hypothetical protein